MSRYDFWISYGRDDAEWVKESFPFIIPRHDEYSWDWDSDSRLSVVLKHNKPEATREEKEAHRASMMASLKSMGFINTEDEPQRFFPDGMTIQRESTQEHLMEEKTLIDEEDQTNRNTPLGEEDSNQNARIAEGYWAAEGGQTAQHLDYETERIFRGFEYFGENLPRWSWGRAGMR
ncbi:hypothetical protein M440DRAFT_348248 [Trichoderma longibrachiatum ATCC 18648]|uniref:Uncharacterized protein n=1 Tax=Trichoderma longibrachiatum ATCC 18648 TaxID=983965 RepID=A0A2T4BSP9_TRILO|nr:hypothetical protein M440DRAFT_348248 [Trichoderma longibrachiatum ATCC 18648]